MHHAKKLPENELVKYTKNINQQASDEKKLKSKKVFFRKNDLTTELPNKKLRFRLQKKKNRVLTTLTTKLPILKKT